MATFWDLAPCSIVEVDRRFRGAYYLRYQGDEPLNHQSTSMRLNGFIFQKAPRSYSLP
jgi:hypothetical protein